MAERGVATTSGWISANVCLGARCLQTAQLPVRTILSVFTIARSTRESMLSTRKENDKLLQKKPGESLLSIIDGMALLDAGFALAINNASVIDFSVERQLFSYEASQIAMSDENLLLSDQTLILLTACMSKF